MSASLISFMTSLHESVTVEWSMLLLVSRYEDLVMRCLVSSHYGVRVLRAVQELKLWAVHPHPERQVSPGTM